jgi:hypothetical protein
MAVYYSQYYWCKLITGVLQGNNATEIKKVYLDHVAAMATSLYLRYFLSINYIIIHQDRSGFLLNMASYGVLLCNALVSILSNR